VRRADPPRLARWLLERFGTASRLNSLVGDLAEEYANGRSEAWYWEQALGTVAFDFLRSLRAHPLSFIVAVITSARRRERTRADASAWLARLCRGLTAEEGSELLEWLKRRSHRACIARSAAESGGPEALAVLGEIFLVNPEWVDSSPRRRPAINGVAALIATFIAALPLLYTHHYDPGLILGPAVEGTFAETMSTVYSSERHALRRVVLADGTRVVMNRETRMVVLGRSVELTRGEATFTVTRHALPPFALTVGDRSFGTLSARFNVRMSGSDKMQLTVLDGTVTVFPSNGRPAANQTALRAGDVALSVPALVNARQTLEIGPRRESVHTLSQREALTRIAWQHG
jgi:ferric-dicitrate binding protein FerR (iron transport regulator)